MSANPLLEAALDYAARGWPVLPLLPRAKAPYGQLVPQGLKQATTDAEQIRRWWDAAPAANVGIATGAPGPDVLDIDDTDRLDSAAHAALQGAVGMLVSTGRGLHLYFTGSAERTVGMPYGELRRRGSYVMAPPSIHPSGATYAWEPGAAPSTMRPVPPEVIAGRRSAGAGDAPAPVDHVPPGEMYDHLLDFAVRLVRAGQRSADAIERALLAEFEVRRAPGREYGGDGRDTRRIAEWAATSDIAARENPSPPPRRGEWEAEPPEAVALTFQTPAELRKGIPAEPNWIWGGSVAAGFITVVGGRPKVGKSTVIYEMIDRLVRGETEFLGAPLAPTDVVIVSEEHAVTALSKLSDSPRLHVATRDTAWPQPDWPTLIRATAAEAKRTGARLVLIDSFMFWAQLGGDAGNDAGAVQEAVNVLVEVARQGVAVVLIHHQRKGGGDFGEALLGSTAFAANADIIIEVERLDEGAPPNYRRLMRVGRWYVPPVVIAAWDRDDGYSLVAEAESPEDAADHIWRSRIEALLRPYGRAMRNAEITEQLGTDSRSWGRAIGSLIAAGAVVKSGTGIQKDPFVYTSVAPDDRPEVPAI